MKNNGHMLIIDDDIEACETMKSLISRMGHSCDMAHTLTSGLRMATEAEYDVIFLDVHLPDGNGLEILPNLMAQPEHPEVIILTGKGDPSGAELAIKGGVWDYLLKPSSVKEITLTLNRALKYRQEKTRKIGEEIIPLNHVIGTSQGIRASLRLTAKAARADTNMSLLPEKPGQARNFSHERSTTTANGLIDDSSLSTVHL